MGSRRIAAAIWLTAVAGCSELVFLKPAVAPRALGARSTTRGPAFDAGAALPDAPDPSVDWGAYNKTPDGDRYSPLRQITVANAGLLRPICTFGLGKRVAMESGPIVIAGTLYLTTAEESLALNASSCRLRWRHRYAYSPGPPFDLKTNRGVAYLDGLLFRGSNDGRVYAIDARTGRERWNVVAGNPDRGESFPAAPVARNGRVYIGNAGGDNYGVTGRMMAFDAKTGGMLWSTPLVPEHGSGDQSWLPMTEMRPRAGAASWTSYTIDTAADLVYVPAGNAAPLFLDALRPGADLDTYSLVALDLTTGDVRRVYQLLHRDFHDWDVAAAPALVTTARGLHLLVEGGKDGHVYGIDVATGVIRYRTAVTTIDNIDAPLTPRGTRFCPGVNGGVEWNGTAYDPATNMVYVNSTDWCTTVRTVAPERLRGQRGLPWTGSRELTHPFGVPDKARSGWLTAVDADDGSVRWRYHAPMPVVAGVTTTAGGLVMTGDLAGNFLVFDAVSGRSIYRMFLHQPIGGGVISYSVRGKQYIAVASGLDASRTWQLTSTDARVTVFALP